MPQAIAYRVGVGLVRGEPAQHGLTVARKFAVKSTTGIKGVTDADLVVFERRAALLFILVCGPCGPIAERTI